MSIEGPLRAARDGLLPNMAELGPYLPVDNLVIFHALAGRLSEQGLKVDAVPEADLNKVERHLISGFFIDEQRRLLVDSPEGAALYDTRFKFQQGSDVVLWKHRGFTHFGKDLKQTFANSAGVIETSYSDGRRGIWWPAAHERYARLGLRAVTLAKSKEREDGKVGIPLEGVDLHQALCNVALASNLPDLIEYVAYQVPQRELRRKVAHDLFYLVSSLAGLHLEEFNRGQGIEALKTVPIKLGRHGNYYAQLGKFPNLTERAYPHIDPKQLVNAKLKCAAHANVPGDNTNLEYVGHAAINAVYDNYVMEM